MVTPKKRMIFHFFVKENWKDRITNRIHLECLKKYSYIFDEVIFVISLDNTNNYDLIRSLELELLDLNLTPNISFKIVENTYLRDSRTFYDFIATKLDEYDGLTFFGHNKGTTNLDIYNLQNVSKWITSMYYLSLEYIDEVVHSLTDGRELSFGSLTNVIDYDKIVISEDEVEDKQKFVDRTKVFLGKNKYLYTGTFFWLNTLSIYEYMRKNDIELPKLTDRWYAENFCANLFKIEFAFSHIGRYSLNYLQDGAEVEHMIRHNMMEEEFEEYLNFHNNIMKLAIQ